ncbi:type VI secretion system baseplate subunit TssF [Marinobacter sp. CA1]|uniref:type VI secretion system baseplate subunit TssF n=1 Tax=Marinobacter sp. CA1 TaxID=2817656 RepID=UPI001D097565|nr:type VI secretion system baseplate subunit TssF [Marinobacter sp. CA1]UDL04786.1 type VI secretion system baseplate subunit TssF [Marinobacter sp. CA1]
MSDELLQYYNRELAYLRRQGAEFAKAYPKVAGNLRVSDESVEDPHVSRLLEGVAFLTAQIRQRLDDHFPELTSILMGNLFPDYMAPIPSMTILQLAAGASQTHCAALDPQQRYETQVERMPACEFRSPSSHYLAPVEVVSGAFENAPFDAPRPAGSEGAQSVIKLRLKSTLPFSEIDLPSLRFYLHGQTHLSNELYDLIHRSGVGFAVVPTHDTRQIRFFGTKQLQPVGFEPEDALVPYRKRSFDGFRLLVEFFLFPEKFLFADLAGLAGTWPEHDEVDLYIYLGEQSSEQEKSFVPEHMRLWCVPAVNLFDESLEPVANDDSNHEHRLVSRFRGAETFEVVSVQSVNLVENENIREMAPFYGLGHPRWQSGLDVYWHLGRRDADWAGGQFEPGFETYLSLVDRRFNHRTQDDLPEDETLMVNAWCCNRNIPERLPFGGGEPRFRAIGEPLVEEAVALVPPTATTRPDLSDGTRWEFIQQLNLEHFAGDDALERLKAVLQLHDFRHTPETQALIEGIEDVTMKRVAARVGKGVHSGLCQGTEIQVTFSKPSYAGTSIYLFSAILDRFFAQFTQVNTFTRVRIRLGGHHRDYCLWPARAGERELL